MATLAQEGAIRAAVAALYANGGFQVVLRLPGLAVSGSDAEQLGLATPQFQELPIGPAVWRSAGVNTALLVAASSIADLVGARGFASAQSLFQSAVGFVVDGVLYVIKDSEPLSIAGLPVAYRVTVERPAWA